MVTIILAALAVLWILGLGFILAMLLTAKRSDRIQAEAFDAWIKAGKP